MEITDSEKLRLLSFLLEYPDEEMIESLRQAEHEIREVLDAECAALTGFVDHLSKTPLIRLQEEYTATFDLNPKHCLNLTYHKWEDSKERGEAIARFAGAFKDSGYGLATRELPDYLPLVLEFLSVENTDNCKWIAEEYAESIQMLKTRLANGQNSYSTVFDILSGIFNEMKCRETGDNYG